MTDKKQTRKPVVKKVTTKEVKVNTKITNSATKDVNHSIVEIVTKIQDKDVNISIVKDKILYLYEDKNYKDILGNSSVLYKIGLPSVVFTINEETFKKLKKEIK